MVVFNGLNWKLSALVEADLHKNENIVDLTTHQTIPLEIIAAKEKFVRVRFLASDLPPVGYKCFQIRTASNSVYENPMSETSPVIENKYYRIKIDVQSGAVQSIFDKQLRRELVDSSSLYRFGQYLYVTGGDPKGDGQTRMIHPSQPCRSLNWWYIPRRTARYLGAQKTAWGYSVKLRSSDVNTSSIGLEMLLFDNEKKIEFRYTVEKSYTTAKEAVYFAFPAAVVSPKFEYGTQQGWVDPSRNMLKGASLEWFSVQKWMAVHDSQLAVGFVPVDASLASFGDI